VNPLRLIFILVVPCLPLFSTGDDLGMVIAETQTRCVKVYGSGGTRGLEAYQSGFLVSPDGHVATVWSYVLDVTPVVVLDDGRRFPAPVVGFEPRLELAILKIDATNLPFFSLQETASPQLGQAVLALSNVFGVAAGAEPVSVMYGHIASNSKLAGKRGRFATPYEGPILILDLIANNPGAAGGALVSGEGLLLGMLGKELRDSRTGAWLNYAIPVSELKPTLRQILEGKTAEAAPPKAKPLTVEQSQKLERLGIVLVPNVLDRTPAFIDQVIPAAPAGRAGLKSDDLIVLVGETRIDSQGTLHELLSRTDRRDALSITLQRGSELIVVKVQPD
jgi:serine protease Do